MVGDFKGSDKDKSAFLGHTASRNWMVGFVVDFATSETNRYLVRVDATSIYPVYITRTASDIEFSYVADGKFVYMQIDIDSTTVTNKVFSNFISAG